VYNLIKRLPEDHAMTQYQIALLGPSITA